MLPHVRRLFVPFALFAMSAGCSDSQASCFAPNTVLPQRAAVLQDASLGQSARDLAAALFDRDLDRAKQLLTRDPALARLPVGKDADMLVVALSTCDLAAVDLLLANGAPADGVRPGMPLVIALRANDPAFATRLLQAGAKATPRENARAPIDTAIGLNSIGGVRLLLDHRGDPNAMAGTGNRPLHTALDMEHFRIAELLLDRGADPWAIDSSGANLATSATTPMIRKDADEAAAQQRLAARVRALGWPDPAPAPRELRALAYAGEWPPAAARAKGAPPVPEEVIAIIRRNTVRH